MYDPILIDYSRDSLLTNFSKRLLQDHYMLPGEKSPQEAFARASLAYCGGDYELAQRIYDYSSKLWFMFASPVLSNAPNPGEKFINLPISCFVLSTVEDTLESIIEHSAEARWLTVKGGGTNGYWGNIRSVGNKSPGPIPFLHTLDADVLAYLDIDHPDIIEFINMRLPEGDVNRRCLNLHNAINITDKFLDAVKNDDEWRLVDPHDKTVRSTLKARELWQTILETRFRTGEPHLHYIDESNRKLPEALKEKGLCINLTNLCSEIFLPTNKDRTAVCCLSSLNLEYYDEWKDTNIVQDLITLLDNVLQTFIDNAPPQLHKAIYSASQERSLGLGAMGFHTYLQKNMIPFESVAAKSINNHIFKKIKERAIEQTFILGQLRGEAPDMKGTGRRNSMLMALAPNANNSIIAGASPSIEPFKSNAYTHNTRIGSVLVKNKYLEEHLEKAGLSTDQIWSNITVNEGSIQHLDLPEDVKSAFKTAYELDQRWIIDHARDRQQHICQGQSVNLFFPPGVDKSYVNSVHLRAFDRSLPGDPLKSLYYLRTDAGVSVDKISEKVERNALRDSGSEELQSIDQECVACSG